MTGSRILFIKRVTVMFLVKIFALGGDARRNQGASAAVATQPIVKNGSPDLVIPERSLHNPFFFFRTILR
jgi:hypothetical protein